METDLTPEKETTPDSPAVADCPAPYGSGACVAAVRGYMLDRSALTDRLVKITGSSKWDGYDKAVKIVTEAIAVIDAQVNRICREQSPAPSQVQYTGHVPCKKCGTTHWMHGPCPQNTKASDR